MLTPIEEIASLTVGSVHFVAPNEIVAHLDIEAPQTLALNTGFPSGFPRINGYVLIPNEVGAVVGTIVWLSTERSSVPARSGEDRTLVDLPFPMRKMSLTPVGTLVFSMNESGQYAYEFQRGVSVFPSIGDPVLLPKPEQLRSIIEASSGPRRVFIGSSPLFGNASIGVDPDRFFGGHVAVLGNTGSGKSCTVAGLVRWSLEAAERARKQAGRAGLPNARFIVLDPNGEYSAAFKDLGTRVRTFQVPPVSDDGEPLKVPAWLWDSREWITFSGAAPGVQRPVLLQALRNLRAGTQVSSDVAERGARLLGAYRAMLAAKLAEGPRAYSGAYNPRKDMCEFLKSVSSVATAFTQSTARKERSAFIAVATSAKSLHDSHYKVSSTGYENYGDFDDPELRQLLATFDSSLAELPEVKEGDQNEDAPIAFDVRDIPAHLEALAATMGSGQNANFVSSLVMRLRMILSDQRLQAMVVPDEQPTLAEWLDSYIGAAGATNGEIAIVDLSIVPTDVVHLVTGVIARVIFEALQRHRRSRGEEIPTVLVLEEAHNFIRKSHAIDASSNAATDLCRDSFERIAREGRKFGLALLLSSQRPSELSETVLAQCNTFLLHRLVNDRDQDLVRKLVPESLGGLFRELPSLPAKQAILVGQATPLPLLVDIDHLPYAQRPKSENPKFWDVWTGAANREIDWARLAKEWTQVD